MTATYGPRGKRFGVICRDTSCPRPLDLTVDTEDHARNLAAKHNREHHDTAATVPETAPLDLTAAARRLLALRDATDGDDDEYYEYRGAIQVWQALTGAPDSKAAYALARQYSAPATTAHIAPF